MAGWRFALGISMTAWLSTCDPQGASPPSSECRRTGCAGHLCAAQEIVTTCEWRPDYACYQQAACAPLPDGSCGFVPSARLSACLAATAGCTHRGERYAVGQGFPAGDGCNSCSCLPGGRIVCTLRLCPDAGAAGPDGV
jgi:hypothetical protein